MPVALFGALEKHLFEHASRTQPLYFANPYEQDDDVTIRLPPGLGATVLPAPRDVDLKAFVYKLRVESASDSVHVTRQMKVENVLIPVKFYTQIREFFQTVRTADEDAIVLAANAPAGAHWTRRERGRRCSAPHCSLPLPLRPPVPRARRRSGCTLRRARRCRSTTTRWMRSSFIPKLS